MTHAFDLDDAVQLLRRTPALLDAWLRGLPDRWVRADEGEGTFSPYEVVGHLVHGERTDWIERTRHVLESRPGAFEPFDRFAQRAASDAESIGERLDTFAELRRANLATLESMGIDAERLDLRGEHPSLGTVTLRELLATWTVHDQVHVAQIARVLAKRYRDDVGPWRAYLPLLDDRSPD